MALNLTAPDFESVRKVIDVNLSIGQLPDEVLSLDAYEGEALRWVAQRTSNEDVHAQSAAVYRLAVLIIPAMPQLLSESNAGYSYQMQARDWKTRLDQLQCYAEEAIARSEAETPTDTGDDYDEASRLTQFTVAPAQDFSWWHDA